MNEELLLWVDENDSIIGYGEKMDTHIREQLHRAFSLFLFNRYDNTMLIHRRAFGKYHSGGLWTNSCCSHPRKGEKLKESVIRRMQEELGFSLPEIECSPTDMDFRTNALYELGSFQYYAAFPDCAEHEIDHVFFLAINQPEVVLSPDSSEIAEWEWLPVEQLKQRWNADPAAFTAWFPPAFDLVLQKVFHTILREETEMSI